MCPNCCQRQYKIKSNCNINWIFLNTYLNTDGTKCIQKNVLDVTVIKSIQTSYNYTASYIHSITI